MVQMLATQRAGRARPFPRVGAWAIVEGKLGIIFELRQARRGKDASFVEAEVHLVDENGETVSDARGAAVAAVVDASTLRQATYDEIQKGAGSRVSHLTPFQAAQVGYALSAKQAASLAPLEKLRLNLELTEAERVDAEIAQSAEDMERLKAQRVAAHPDTAKLEEQIEKERVAFIADVERRRTALHKKLAREK